MLTVYEHTVMIHLIKNYSRGFSYTAAGVPGTVIGSRWLECHPPKLHASLFSGPMLLRLHIFMSVLTHSDQVFLGLPLLLALGVVILVMEFVHEEEHVRCSNLLRRSSLESCCHLLHAQHSLEFVCGHSVIISDSAYPSDH